MGPAFHETVRGSRFFEAQLPALIKNLALLTEKQTACNIIAAGIHAGNEDMTADGAATRAIETYDAIKRKLS